MPAYTDPSVLEPFVPGEIDHAETFSESDVTLTHNFTGVQSEAIVTSSDGNTSRSSDSNQFSGSGRRGLVINPNVDLNGVAGILSANTSGLSEIEVYDTSNNLLAETTVSGNSGESWSISVSLTAGTKYQVVGYDGGNSYTVGDGSDTDSNFPYTGPDLDITGGVNSLGTFGSSYDTHVVQDVHGVAPASGTCYVEWPYPTDVYEWGGAYFDEVTDGDTVAVYVEEYDGTNWNEVAGPIASGDKIPSKPANNVRFRVELSRTSKSNNPRLLEIARREVFKNA